MDDACLLRLAGIIQVRTYYMQELKGVRIYTGNGHEDFVIGKKLNRKTDRHITTLVDDNIVEPMAIIENSLDNSMTVICRLYPLVGTDKNETILYKYKSSHYRVLL